MVVSSPNHHGLKRDVSELGYPSISFHKLEIPVSLDINDCALDEFSIKMVLLLIKLLNPVFFLLKKIIIDEYCRINIWRPTRVQIRWSEQWVPMTQKSLKISTSFIDIFITRTGKAETYICNCGLWHFSSRAARLIVLKFWGVSGLVNTATAKMLNSCLWMRQ